VAIYVKKVKSRKLVGHAGSIGDGSENPDIRITYDWRTARYYINGVSPLDCRTAEELYLSDEELRARDDQRGTKPAVADYQPNTLRTAGATDFDEQANPEQLPNDWRPSGRIISNPINPAPDALF
jgi:hypothetical protein